MSSLISSSETDARDLLLDIVVVDSSERARDNAAKMTGRDRSSRRPR
jgi:hypothetical protein